MNADTSRTPGRQRRRATSPRRARDHPRAHEQRPPSGWPPPAPRRRPRPAGPCTSSGWIGAAGRCDDHQVVATGHMNQHDGRRSPLDGPTTSSRNTGRPKIVLPFRPPLDRYSATCRAVVLRPKDGNRRATRFVNRAETNAGTLIDGDRQCVPLRLQCGVQHRQVFGQRRLHHLAGRVGKHLLRAGLDGRDDLGRDRLGADLSASIPAAMSVSMKPACTATTRVPWRRSSMRNACERPRRGLRCAVRRCVWHGDEREHRQDVDQRAAAVLAQDRANACAMCSGPK